MKTARLRHDPACLLLDLDYDGPHIVPPDHPVLQNQLVYRCRKCGWAFHDPSWQDIEDHWEGGHDTRPRRNP